MLGRRSAVVGLVWRSLRAPKLKQPMVAFDINSPSAASASENSDLPCAFVWHFRPYCTRLDIHYVLRVYELYVPKWEAKGRKVQEFGRKRSDWLVPKRSQSRNRKCTTPSSRTVILWHWQWYCLTMALTMMNLQSNRMELGNQWQCIADYSVCFEMLRRPYSIVIDVINSPVS